MPRSPAQQILSTALLAMGDNPASVARWIDGHFKSDLAPSSVLVRSGLTEVKPYAVVNNEPDAPLTAALTPNDVSVVISRHIAQDDPPHHLGIALRPTSLAPGLRLRGFGIPVLMADDIPHTSSGLVILAEYLASARARRAVLILTSINPLLPEPADPYANQHECDPSGDELRFAIAAALVRASQAAVAFTPAEPMTAELSDLFFLKETAPRSSLDTRIEDVRLTAAEFDLALSEPDQHRLARLRLPHQSLRSLLYTIHLGTSIESALALKTSSDDNAPARIAPPDEVFNPHTINADRNIDEFVAQLLAKPPKRPIFLFHGPSGTGKSALAVYISRRLGYDPIIVPGSEIEESKVGETEKNIARIFKDAAANDAALIFDECDGLLCSRANARQSYDLSRVNEFLVHLERHTAPLFMTTNLFDMVDSAVKRRIPFKMEIKPLRHSQIVALWPTFFTCAAPADLPDLEGLTPGDFAAVRDQGESSAMLSNPAWIVQKLIHEIESKGARSNRVGFVTTRIRD